MGDPVLVAVAAVTAVCLLVAFSALRLWVQALLTRTPVSLSDIIGMRLRRCPPGLIVHALIALHQRGVRVSAREAEGYYLAAIVRGEGVASAGEFADLVESRKRAAGT